MAPRHACSRFAEVEDFTATECACGVVDATLVEQYLDDASDLLYALSRGQIFGLCEATVRPCRCCFCGCCLACCDIDAIPLRGPVVEISEIKIDGVVLDSSEYVLLPRDRVMRVSTSDQRPPGWPGNQALWKPDTEDDTFSITHTFGMAPPYPHWIVQANVELACDMATWTIKGTGALPANASSVIYQGVSLSLSNRARLLEQHVDRLPAVSRFFGIVSQFGGGGVFSPDGVDGWKFPLS